MPATIQIFLDKSINEGVCYGGQKITGRVECNFSSEKKLRAVRIKFEGHCFTGWYEAEHKGIDEFPRQVRYSAGETYFLRECNLAGDGTVFKLPAGKYNYRFSFILPERLPSSFENHLGKVHYTITAKVDCPWRYDDTALAVLRLISPIDLNNFPHLGQPVAICVDKPLRLYNFSGNSNPLTLKVSLPATAYATGQQVQVGVHVQNPTNINVEKSAKFIVHHPSTKSRKSEQILVVSCLEGGIAAYSEKQWTSVLTIPTHIHIPNMEHCKLIYVNYRLQGEVVVPPPHTNLTAVIPLMLGNIPLADVHTSLPLVQTKTGDPYLSAPVVPGPPPPYEELQLQAGIVSNNTFPQQTKSDLEDSDKFVKC